MKVASLGVREHECKHTNQPANQPTDRPTDQLGSTIQAFNNKDTKIRGSSRF
jgi:hypothetical protein